ncbi:hypothetical protein [Yellowstone lake phycodnavirus 2]|uniref:hypothetical protein n=1 Tax=Yellowstone lake phycodnavirus 2 TaxID=1586714 RepID=UPI0006EBBB69|nr:hypothetical protein AR678_gp154 [Yellowstone lake phycodnavirus 2]BAT22428.1 hypothetical protein [Yellowstone lake phycodnavirus 2]
MRLVFPVDVHTGRDGGLGCELGRLCNVSKCVCNRSLLCSLRRTQCLICGSGELLVVCVARRIVQTSRLLTQILRDVLQLIRRTDCVAIRQAHLASVELLGTSVNLCVCLGQGLDLRVHVVQGGVHLLSGTCGIHYTMCLEFK